MEPNITTLSLLSEEKRKKVKKEIEKVLDSFSDIEWRELEVYPDGVISLEIDLIERKKKLGENSPFQWVSVRDCEESDTIEMMVYKTIREVKKRKNFIRNLL